LENHELMQAKSDQTWYFVIADCKGALEIFRDETTKRDHLLGLDALWQDIDEDNYKDNENKNAENLALKRTKFGASSGYTGSDSFEETNLLMEIIEDDGPMAANSINGATKKSSIGEDDDEDDFDFEEYAINNRLKTL